MTSQCIAQADLPQPSSRIAGVHHCTWMVSFCLCALSAMLLPCFPWCAGPAEGPGLSSPLEALRSLSGVQSDRTVGRSGQQGHRTSMRTKDAWILVAVPSKPAGSSAPGDGYCGQPSWRASLPKFLIRGHLDSTSCAITQPLTGELVVEHSDAAIRSIELQLVRVETCGCAEGYARDATEIQNIQIADGDICRSLSVPLYMVFPRLFTCPTLETTNFKVEFEVNVVVLLHADHLITENFPLKLCRT
ncbi:vacuolar protein sorting-associated protein 26C isoform X2 [Microtus pennsylvanicus]|uniref:vacuolar protein sorting-associated protein 26C isoform X2 n=1 Tax=Microtus pennsylvanicus TaxID=10058 RepID=UPI003F6A8E67